MNANSCELVCLHVSSNNVPEHCTQCSHTCLNTNHCKHQTVTCSRDVKCSFDVVLMVLFHTESDRTESLSWTSAHLNEAALDAFTCGHWCGRRWVVSAAFVTDVVEQQSRRSCWSERHTRVVFWRALQGGQGLLGNHWQRLWKAAGWKPVSL